MLGLKLPTDPRWVDVAGKNLEEILVDHAYCEQKAASSGISLIVQYPDRAKLVEVLTEVVAEEWGHFERVLAQLRQRGMKLGRQRRDAYVVALSQHVRKGGNPEEQLLDKLLLCALIEARSCERFRILSQEIDDADLRAFYHELMISEAGHYVTFIDLAKEYLPHDLVKKRLEEMLVIEAEIIQSLEIRGDRMH